MQIKLTELVDPSFLQGIQDAFSECSTTSSVMMDMQGNHLTTPSYYSETCRELRGGSRSEMSCPFAARFIGGDKALFDAGQSLQHGKCLHCELLTKSANIEVRGEPIATWRIGHRLMGNANQAQKRAVYGHFDTCVQLLEALSRAISQLCSNNVYLQGEVDSASRNLDYQKLISDILYIIFREGDQPDTPAKLLGWIGEHLSADRAYVLEDGSRGQRVHEWHREGVTPYRPGRRKALWFLGELSSPPTQSPGKLFLTESLEHVSDEYIRSRMRRRDVQSFLSSTLMQAESGYRGVIVIESTDPDRSWTQEEVDNASTLVGFVASVLLRGHSRMQVELSSSNTQTVLNNLDAFIYVADMETYELRFANKKLIDIYESPDMVGRKCYEALYGSDKPCSFCPRKHLAQLPDPAASYHWEHFNSKLKRWFAITDSVITWVDGRAAHLETAMDVSEKKATEQAIERLAYYDDLLGIPNRTRCQKDLEDILAQSPSSRVSGYVLFIDLDDFKNINDAYGHDIGDLLLNQVSEYLSLDPDVAGRVYRFGGDEFIIILNQYDLQTTREVTRRIQKRFAQPWQLTGRSYYCTLSLGIVKYPEHGATVKDVIQHVDFAMYTAKNEGKNRAVFYSQTLNEFAQERLEMEMNLRHAVAEGCRDFFVVYQPEVDLATGRWVGAEALVRWQTRTGMAPPVQFISLAEETNLILPIGEHVLKTACMQITDMALSGYGDFYVGVNLSVKQLSNPGFLMSLKSVMEETGVNPQNLMLEITESLAMHDLDNAITQLKAIRDLGVRIAMDDFGTGYSSLSNLRKLPLDLMKIDRAFIVGIEEQGYKDREFLRSIINVAHSIGLQTLCEGIENEAQYHLLKDMGCNLAQGYFYGKPMLSGKLNEMLQMK